MANGNHYPSVVLLDNENNPITPLVDITSIYQDVMSKEDAGVLVAPIEYKDIDDEVSIDEDGELYDDENNVLYLIVGAEVNDRKITFKRVRASRLLGNFVDERTWEALHDRDDVPIEVEDENGEGHILQVKKEVNKK